MRRLLSVNMLRGVGAVGMVAVLGIAGCGTKTEVEVPTANQVATSVQNAANTVQKEAGPAVKSAVKAVETTAAPVVKVTEETGMNAKVKAAIIADQSVDSTKINVDVKNNSVILRGRVKNAAQRAKVQNIAKQQAPKYSIIDQLQLEGATVKVVPAKPKKK